MKPDEGREPISRYKIGLSLDQRQGWEISTRLSTTFLWSCIHVTVGAQDIELSQMGHSFVGADGQGSQATHRE
jgi:hypothetical protein